MPRNYIKWLKWSLEVIFVVALFGAAIYFARQVGQNEVLKAMIQHYGYAAVFLVSFVGGLNIAIPVPAVSFLPLFAQAGLSLKISALLIVVGTTLADSVGYFIGRVLRNVAPAGTRRWISRFERWQTRYHFAPLIFLAVWAAFVPLPNEIIILPLAIVGYKFVDILPFIVVGNAIFTTLAALGVINLFQLIQKF